MFEKTIISFNWHYVALINKRKAKTREPKTYFVEISKMDFQFLHNLHKKLTNMPHSASLN
jgi:hypothetical protein